MSVNDPRTTRVIRDPIHDYIELPIQINRLLDDPLVQRLRFIGQTTFSSSVFPAMTGTRFEHSLGTMHLARLAWFSAWRHTSRDGQKRFEKDVKADLEKVKNTLDAGTTKWLSGHFVEDFELNIGLAIAAAGLLHDLGHPPFSHGLESFYVRNIHLIYSDNHTERSDAATALNQKARLETFHTIVGSKLISQIPSETVKDLPWHVVNWILDDSESPNWARALHSIVSGEVDVDRLDYLLRDAAKSGTEFGSIDAERLLQSLELHDPSGFGGNWKVGYGYRARTAIETFLVNRLRYYQWVLFHPHVVAANKFLDSALQEIVNLSKFSESTVNETLSHVEHELATAIERARPNLNYFELKRQSYRRSLNIDGTQSRPKYLLEDKNLIELQSEVDDSSILEWLKRSASLCRAAIDGKSLGSGFQERVSNFLSFYEALRTRTPNWAPVWKTEDIYRDIADKVRPSLVKVIENLTSEIDSEIRMRIRNKQMDVVLQNAQLGILIPLREQFERDSVEGLNGIARFLLDSPYAEVRWEYEQSLSHEMGRASMPSRSLQGGLWKFSYQRISALGESNDAVQVWKDLKPVPLRDLSTFIKLLPKVEKSHPQLFAFFIRRESELRDGRESPHSDDLRKHFIQTFPPAVEVLLSTKIRSIS